MSDDDMWMDSSDVIKVFLNPFKAIICPNEVWKLK